MRPFRVKRSYVVAIRNKPTSKTATWLEPLPNRDDTIALIGQHIRCILPKTSELVIQSSLSNGPTRLIEGEVIGFVKPWNEDPLFLHIQLLIPKENAKQLPSSIQMENDYLLDDDTLTEKERLFRMYENDIKGKDNVVIQLQIPRAIHMSKNTVRWAICKHMKTSTEGYVGDWNDSITQQQKNYQWCLNYKRYRREIQHDPVFKVGEVVEVIPLATTKGKNKSLAKVIVQPLMFVEDTKAGRMGHYSFQELLEYTSAGRDASTVEIPIEDLIVIGKKVHREPVLNGNGDTLKPNHFRIRYRYNVDEDVYEPLNTVKTGDDGYRICARCHVLKQEHEMLKCNGPCLKGSISNWWCCDCIHFIEKWGMHSFQTTEAWIGPCCLGLDDTQMFSKHKFHNKQDSTVTCCTVCSLPIYGSKVQCDSCSCEMHQRCFKWIVDLRSLKDIPSDISKRMCFECHSNVRSSLTPETLHGATFLQKAANFVQALNPKDFHMPPCFLETLPISKSKPIEQERDTKLHKKTKHVTSPKLSPVKTSARMVKKSVKRQKKHVNDESQCPLTVTVSLKDFSILGTSLNENIEEKETNSRGENNDTCSRIIPYDPSKKLMRSANNSAAHARSALAAMRSGGKIGSDRGRNQHDNKSNGRKSRVNQRRMLKDSAVFGEFKEKLAGCEHALRFGKSLIHGWGVFTDEHISKGDLIVEYRGVLIGHAVANKREKEYEEAKIGSDYMFRISNSVVCDATHEGNVTRFINACCSPNCQTKILVVNGVKRIAVYAKKDIQPGEELSYDYKFQPEFDESKRIPCNCGATDCRKFMNWDYRYVDVSKISDTVSDRKPRTKNIE